MKVAVNEDACVLEDPVSRIKLGWQFPSLIRSRDIRDSVEEGNVSTLGGNSHCEPVDVSPRLPPHLQDVRLLSLSQANWTVAVGKRALAQWIVRGAGEVIAEVALGIKNGEPAVWFHDEGQVSTFSLLVLCGQ